MQALKNFNTREAASYLKECHSIPVTPGTSGSAENVWPWPSLSKGRTLGDLRSR